MTPVRLVQLSRIYGEALETDAAAAACIARDPGRLGQALFEEAVESDDVTSAEAARAYRDDRLSYFDGLIPDHVREPLLGAFDERLRAWAGG